MSELARLYGAFAEGSALECCTPCYIYDACTVATAHSSQIKAEGTLKLFGLSLKLWKKGDLDSLYLKDASSTGLAWTMILRERGR